MNWRRMRVAFGGSVGLCVVVGCGSSPAMQTGKQGEPSKAPARIRPMSWRLARVPEGRIVHIYNSIGWCSGAPKPYIASVRVRERGAKVVLTAFLGNPPRRKGACADLAMGVGKVVKLHRPLGLRALFDGVRTPAIKRWPHAAHP